MYAVIKTGGKQYKVSAGDKIKVEQIPADIGADIHIDQVLAVGSGDQIRIGVPLVGGAAVSATVLSQGRHPKVRIFKMRRRKHYQKHQGHRQNYTELLISQIASELGVFSAQATAGAAQRAPAGEAQPDVAGTVAGTAQESATNNSHAAEADTAQADTAQADTAEADNPVAPDDLARIEGVGPRIAEILQAAGIMTFADLAATPLARLKDVLAAAGSTYATHDPGTWAEQATLAARGDWEAFDKLKAELDGGRRA